ncbi:MAG: thioredoxin family protein [Bacteroidetes bacterium]|nr:thioredoxin family protein [Bacteroidota bacterium]
MKTIYTILIFAFSTQLAFAGEGGVNFLTEDYEKAVVQAKQEQKFMLLDFTASWCFPCKKMDRETFPDTELGDFVNSQFVSFKVNADFFWGMDIADEFKVKAYPTILVVDNLGRIVKRITGYRTAEMLLQELRPLSGLN